MSTRRQANTSTTSLSKYARINSPVVDNRSLDFCNAFWGLGDVGVEVLFARMRGATRTIDELKNFWKERASIEEDYAKRLAKLAKVTLGRDEIGELRNSLETVRQETDRQAGFHHALANQIRADLEAPTAAFNQKQVQHKKVQQAMIEKEFKAKQTQETYVNKAREKYEQDCVRINSFTAQASLVQGRDLERINLKLERTQQTVHSNEREFSNFAKALAETVQKWENNWKAFCDSCQDLEEDRMDFMKDNVWAYANAVSTVCVSDDESCEKMRLSLEQMETERDMLQFVHDYGTGNQIPDPPAFVNYQAPDAIPSSSAKPTSRPAQFIRNTTRDYSMRQIPGAQDEEEPVINTAGVGAGGGVKRAETYMAEGVDLSRQPTRGANGATSQAQQIPYTNGISSNQMQSHSPRNSHPQQGPLSAPPANLQRAHTISAQQQLQQVLRDPHAETIDPTAETYIKVGNNAYKVDPNRDPQQQTGPSSIRHSAPSPSKPNGGVDPLMKQLEELQNTVSTTGSVRRNTLNVAKPSNTAEQKLSHVSTSSVTSLRPTSLLPPDSLTGPPNSQKRTPSPGVRDYRNSAEVIVGAHPSVSRPPSRSASPNPPVAAFMVPKPSVSPSDSGVIQEVLAGYQQSLPGERRSTSRNNNRGDDASLSQVSVHSGQSQAQSQNQNQTNLGRPLSQLGHAGIGAHGSRSNSPQPMSRGPSPAPTSGSNQQNQSQNQNQAKNNYIQPPPNAPVRSASPNTVGIALDPSGRVLHDEMAHRYQQQHQQQQQQQRPPQPAQAQQIPYNAPPQQLQQQQQPVRRTSYIAPPVAQAPYAVTPPPPPNMYQTPSPQPNYMPPPAQPVYNPSPVQYQPPPPQPHQQQQQPRYPHGHAQPTQLNSYNSPNGPQRAPSMTYYGGGTPPQQQPMQQAPPPQMLAVQPPQQQQQQQQRVVQAQTQPLRGGYQQQHPPQQQQQQQQMQQQMHTLTGRSPSPQPYPQTTEGGDGILFYVKALYDYTATIEEEFDFQAGDIIAVTATPEDGWWSGELLDEARRQRGRNVFPSNFVCLF